MNVVVAATITAADGRNNEDSESVWFLCKICRRIFPRKKLLIRHKRQVHPKEEGTGGGGGGSQNLNEAVATDPPKNEKFIKKERTTTAAEKEKNSFITSIPPETEKTGDTILGGNLNQTNDPFQFIVDTDESETKTCVEEETSFRNMSRLPPATRKLDESTKKRKPREEKEELLSPKLSGAVGTAGKIIESPPHTRRIHPEQDEEKGAPLSIKGRKEKDEFLIPSVVLQKITIFNCHPSEKSRNRTFAGSPASPSTSTMTGFRDARKCGKNRPINDEKLCQNPPPRRPPSKRKSRKEENRCKFCAKKLSCPRTLFDHLRLHTGETPFGCMNCEETFSTPSQLSRHRWRCQFKTRRIGRRKNPPKKSSPSPPPSPSPTASVNPGKGKWKCRVCSKEFSTLSKSAVHNCQTKIPMATTKYSNHGNQQKTRKNKEKSTHLLGGTEKFIVPQTYGGKNVFVCSFCMKVFSYVSLATSHVTNHLKNCDPVMVPNLTEIVGQSDTAAAAAYAGMPVLEKEVDDPNDDDVGGLRPEKILKTSHDKMAVQSKCSAKTYRQKHQHQQQQVRKRWSQQEEREEPPKDGDQDNHFMDHVTTKLNGKTCSYVCNFCGKTYRFPSHIKRHMPLHTRQRQSKCSVAGCSKKFSTIYAQWRHGREEHNFPNNLKPLNKNRWRTRLTSKNDKLSPNSFVNPALAAPPVSPPPKKINSQNQVQNSSKNNFENDDEDDLYRKSPSPIDPDSDLNVRRRRGKVKGISKVEAWLAREAENMGPQEETRLSSSASTVAAAAASPPSNPPVQSEPISSSLITPELHGEDQIFHQCSLCRQLFDEWTKADEHLRTVHHTSSASGGGGAKEKKEPGTVAAKIVQNEEKRRWSVESMESRYCLCNQVAYGKMVACDFQDCPIEWFHFQCVGLTATPPGQWFCPQCACEEDD